METSPALRERVQNDRYRRLRTVCATVLVGASMRIVGRMVTLSLDKRYRNVRATSNNTSYLFLSTPNYGIYSLAMWCGTQGRWYEYRPLGGNPVNMQCPSLALPITDLPQKIAIMVARHCGTVRPIARRLSSVRSRSWDLGRTY